MEQVVLGEVAEFVRGITFKPTDLVPLGTSGSVRCMRTKNVQAELDQSDVWAIPKKFVKRGEQFLRAGDVLVSSANSWNLVGKCCWVPDLPEPTTFGGFISVLRRQVENLDPRFLYWWFSSGQVQAAVRSFGQQTTNISNLNIDRTMSLRVPLFPLEEQRRIAGVLDRADDLRAKRRVASETLESLKRSIFLDMFGDPVTNPLGWPRISFASGAKRITVGVVVRPASHYVPIGVPALRSLNVKPGRLDLKELVYFSSASANSVLAKSRLNSGDVVVVRTGKPGTAAVVPTELDGANAIDLIIMTPDTDVIDPLYTTQFLNSSGGQRLVMGGGRGQIQQHLNVGVLKAAKLPCPPIAKQREFADRVRDAQSLQERCSSSEQGFVSLCRVLTDRAFAGAL